MSDVVSPRETEALIRCVHGQKVAAAQMGVSLATVKFHLSLAYAKLGVLTLVEAYQKLGWLELPEVS